MYRKRLIILFVSIFIYLLLIYIKWHFNNNNFAQVYVLTKNVIRGEKLNLDNLKKVNINKKDLSINYVENVDNLVTKSSLNVGQIITKENVIKSDSYKKIENQEKEISLIKVSNSDTNINYDIDVGSIVNIYYTGRSSQLEKIQNSTQIPAIESSSIADGYTTFLLLKEIEIKNIYNRNGKLIDKKISNNQDNIDTIGVEVDSETAILIENIKKYGTFSITIKR